MQDFFTLSQRAVWHCLSRLEATAHLMQSLSDSQVSRQASLLMKECSQAPVLMLQESLVQMDPSSQEVIGRLHKMFPEASLVQDVVTPSQASLEAQACLH